MNSKFHHLRRLLGLVGDGSTDERDEASVRVPIPRSAESPIGQERVKRILIMSQDEDIRFLLSVRSQMRECFDECLESGDAESALRAAKRTQPDVVVVHLLWATPEECAVVTALKVVSPRSSVVAYSNLLWADTQVVATQAGADRYVTARGSIVAIMDEAEKVLRERESNL